MMVCFWCEDMISYTQLLNFLVSRAFRLPAYVLTRRETTPLAVPDILVAE